MRGVEAGHLDADQERRVYVLGGFWCGGGSGINTRPSIIMTGSRKCSPFTVTWLPAVLAARGRKIKMIARACV